MHELNYLLDPSPEFIRLAVKNPDRPIETGALTQSKIEAWKPILASAIQEWAKQYTLKMALQPPVTGDGVDDDASESGFETVDRGTWEKRVGGEIMKTCDRIVEIANEVAEPKLELKYQKNHLGICPPGSFFNVAALFPKKAFLAIRMSITDSEAWLKKLEQASVEVKSKKAGRITIRIRPAAMQKQEAILRDLIHQAVREF